VIGLPGAFVGIASGAGRGDSKGISGIDAMVNHELNRRESVR
jgi:hypothetical protein